MSDKEPQTGRPLAETILDLILHGEYKPGDRLAETELAERLGVSRSPVRIALRSLEKTGVVTIKSNRGAWVTTYSLKDVDDIYQARAVLEPLVATLAMEQISTVELDELTRLAQNVDDEIMGQSRPSVIAELNNQFHRYLLSKCENKYLVEASQRLMVPLVVTNTFKFYSESELRRSSQHHFEMIDAIKNRDPVWLQSVMSAHIRFGSHSSRKSIAQQLDPSGD